MVPCGWYLRKGPGKLTLNNNSRRTWELVLVSSPIYLEVVVVVFQGLLHTLSNSLVAGKVDDTVIPVAAFRARWRRSRKRQLADSSMRVTQQLFEGTQYMQASSLVLLEQLGQQIIVVDVTLQNSE
jgi:hypothetical protein